MHLHGDSFLAVFLLHGLFSLQGTGQQLPLVEGHIEERQLGQESRWVVGMRCDGRNSGVADVAVVLADLQQEEAGMIVCLTAQGQLVAEEDSTVLGPARGEWELFAEAVQSVADGLGRWPGEEGSSRTWRHSRHADAKAMK